MASKVSTALETDDFPSHLSFHQYKSILSFENEKIFNENEEQIDQSTSTMNWNTIMNDAKETYGKANASILSSSSTSTFSSAKNNNQKMLPYVVCHLDDSSLCGTERYEILQSIFADLSDSASSSNFIIDELPIYNHNEDHSNTKLKKDTVSGACFYSSLRPSLVQQVTEKNVFVTPLLSFLKLRRANFKSNERDVIDTTTRAISVHLSPGHASSQDTVMEYAYGLLKVISKDLSTDITTTSSCNADMIKAFSSASVTVSSNDASVFYYEILTSSKNSIITHGCYNEFTEYLANQHETVSVELIAKTVLHNDIVRWIVESSVENSKPWSDIGLNGENQILQVSDSGLDESHCYFKDATGVVPLTTDFDLTGGRIDKTKRKVINYVALSEIGDRKDHSKHGSHVVGTILGKRSDNGVNEVPGLIDGVASASKVTFFDANDPEDDKIMIPVDITQMFYFGKQSQAFGHSASWGSNSYGGQYSSRSKEIDQYFYESEEDDFIMFVAAGNNGTTSGARIDDPCQSKNVICVGASNSAGKNLKTGMLDMNYIAFFSSRGPTADNRIKPDVIAPGYSVLSVNANSGSCDPSNRPQYEESKQESAGTIFLRGTSMACPIVAGSAALVRQYFQEKHNPPMNISGTLLKAVLINGAQALNGRSVADTGSSNEAFSPSSPYDKFQAFGRINLLKSLKHPDDSYNSPDIHVEDERVLQQGQTHKYEFDVCDAHEFRVTIVWRDPPNGSEGCSKCLVNDLDLEVELNGQVYHPNGKSGKDSRNNVERVVLSEDDFPSSSSNSVVVKVRAANLGFGNLQAYSLTTTGCIKNEAELVTPTQSPTASCGPDQFELTLELFTNRRPEETSWLLEYQGSGGVIDSGRAGEYDKRLHSYSEKNCVNFGCFLFIIKDTAFDGLCCVKGMGSYIIYAGDKDKILVEGNSFQDRQEIQKFCHPGSNATESLSSSSTMLCNEDEFKYELNIQTDLYPDETRWELRSSELDQIIDSIPFMTYRKQLESYSHTGCLSYDKCYELLIYDKRRDGLCCYFGSGSYKLSVGNDVIVQGNHFDDAIYVGGSWYNDPDYFFNKHEFCYDRQPSEAPPSFSVQPTPNPTEMECKGDEFEYRIRVRTHRFPDRISWEFKYSNGTVIEILEYGGYFVEHYEHNHRGCLPLDECFEFHIEADGSLCCRYGDGGYTIFVNDDVMAEGREGDDKETKTFCYGPSYSFSPTSSPTIPLVCDENEFKYEVVVTTDLYPFGTWWELSYDNGTIIDNVDRYEYNMMYTEHVHEGCLDLDSCVIFTIFDSAGDGLCCDWGNGGYTIMVDDVVMAEGGSFDDEETTTFCYGPSVTNYPSSSSDVCESGSNNDASCGYWAWIGACDDDSGSQDWMQKHCAKACSNCCMDYDDDCDDNYYDGRCTDTSQYNGYDVTWQEWMQASCRYSCDTCDVDLTPTPHPVTCSDDRFKYEILATDVDDDDYLIWVLFYKYTDLEIERFEGIFPPNYEKRYYGCAKYSCFELSVKNNGYLKIYDNTTGTLIAQNTEPHEVVRFCHYDLKEVIFTITLKFSRIPSDNKEEVEDISRVIQTSIKKIIFRAQTDDENLFVDILGSSCNEEYECELVVEVCTGFFCEGEEPPFRSLVGNTLDNLWKSGDLLTVSQHVADFMNVDIFDESTQILSIDFEFDFESWSTTAPTAYTPECTHLLSMIMNLFQPRTKDNGDNCGGEIRDDDHVIDDCCGWDYDYDYDSYGWTDDSYGWTDDYGYDSADISCTDRTFELQLEFVTDCTPNRSSWELLFEDGTVIDSVGQDTYSEWNKAYYHTYCLEQSCFIFNMFDSFGFKGSYSITVGDTVLVQQDGFLGWKDTKHFCYPVCDDDGMFLLEIELVTDDWPHEIYWQLAHSDYGTIIDHVDARYYTEANKLYDHRHCLLNGCYDLTFHDYIGDGFGEGTYKIKINDGEIIKEGGEFSQNKTTSFCYPACEDCEGSLSFIDTIANALSGLTSKMHFFKIFHLSNRTGNSIS